MFLAFFNTPMEKDIPEKDLFCSNIVEKVGEKECLKSYNILLIHTQTSTARLGLMGWIGFTG